MTAHVAANEAEGLPPTILVVDDEPDVREQVARILRPMHCRVQVADSVDRACALFRHDENVAVVLSDIYMPGRSGLDLALLLQAERGDVCAAEVVLMTGHGIVDDALRAFPARVFDLVEKPFTGREIRDVVTRALDCALHRRALARGSVQRARAATPADLVPDSIVCTPFVPVLPTPVVPESHDEIQRRSRIIADLPHLLNAETIELRYQPILDLASGRVRGFEALLRWRHPTYGLVMPDEFLESARALNLMAKIDGLVIRTALASFAEWRHAGCASQGQRGLNLNVSATCLSDPGFQQFMEEEAQRRGIPPSTITLEVLESESMSCETIQALHDLKRRKFQIAVDDFGTGQSNLSRLTEVPADVVKLDRSFVPLLAGDASARRFIANIVDLVHALGPAVVIEGIEDARSLPLAAAAGFDGAQGYAVARPLEPAEASRIEDAAPPGMAAHDGSGPIR